MNTNFHKKFCSAMILSIIFSMIMTMPGMADMVMVFEVNGKARVSDENKDNWVKPLKKGFLDNKKFVKTFDKASVVFVEHQGSMKKMDSNQLVFINNGLVKSINGDVKVEKGSMLNSITSYIRGCFSKEEEQVQAVAKTGENITEKSDNLICEMQRENSPEFDIMQKSKRMPAPLNDAFEIDFSASEQADKAEKQSFMFNIFSKPESFQSKSFASKRKKEMPSNSSRSMSPRSASAPRVKHPVPGLDISQITEESVLGLLVPSVAFKVTSGVVLRVTEKDSNIAVADYKAPIKEKKEKIINNSGLVHGRTYNVGVTYPDNRIMTFKIRIASIDEYNDFMVKRSDAIRSYTGTSRASINAFNGMILQKQGYYANAVAYYLRAADQDDDKPSFFKKLADMCEKLLYK